MLSYKLVPSFSVGSTNEFEGSVSFNGRSKDIYGNYELNFGNFSYWFLENFMNSPHLALPALDVDGDGISNIFEYGLGTDPINDFNSSDFYDVFVENDLFVYELFIQKDDLNLSPLVAFKYTGLILPQAATGCK